MDNLYNTYIELNKAFNIFLSDISYINACNEWSNFYSIVEDNSIEFYITIINLEFKDAGMFDKSDYELFINTLNDIFYANDLSSYYKLDNNSNTLIRVLEASNRLKKINSIKSG